MRLHVALLSAQAAGVARVRARCGLLCERVLSPAPLCSAQALVRGLGSAAASASPPRDLSSRALVPVVGGEPPRREAFVWALALLGFRAGMRASPPPLLRLLLLPLFAVEAPLPRRRRTLACGARELTGTRTVCVGLPSRRRRPHGSRRLRRSGAQSDVACEPHRRERERQRDDLPEVQCPVHGTANRVCR